MTHILEADSIQLEFGSRKILTDVYFSCETGKICGLFGRNGQGKSCLMNIIYGSLEARSKSIRIDQTPVFQAFKRSDLMLYLPQFNFIPGSVTVKRVFQDFNLSYPDFETLFPEFRSKYRSRICNLSGGQRRVVEVYAIIKSQSRFVLLDEPFTHIMPLQIEKIREIMIEEKANKGMLVTDHMYREIAGICDSIYVLKDGKLHVTKSIQDLETFGYAKL